jgi:hypothetical protein
VNLSGSSVPDRIAFSSITPPWKKYFESNIRNGLSGVVNDSGIFQYSRPICEGMIFFPFTSVLFLELL